jgi:regulator of RNase E activity RraB
LVQERNAAWDERDLLRQRVDELEEYNIKLHEEFHTLYNGVGPYAPPDTAGMDVDDDDKDEPTTSPSGDGDVSNPDDDPEE